MISPALAVQRSIRARLIADPEVTNLVAADRIVSTGGLPEAPFPVVLLGEDQEVALGEVTRRHFEVHSGIHIWTAETGMQLVRDIGGVIFGAICTDLTAVPCVVLHDVRFVSGRYMRDPGGKLAHGVLSIRTVAEIVQ